MRLCYLVEFNGTDYIRVENESREWEKIKSQSQKSEKYHWIINWNDDLTEIHKVTIDGSDFLYELAPLNKKLS